jgi:iron-sulfur cluster assembly accessory protein
MAEQTQPIVTLTASTVEHIKKCLKNHSQGSGFRLTVKKSGCSGYAYVPKIVQTPEENDIKLEQDGITVYIDAKSAPMIKGTVLDYVESGLGQKEMVFRNPNATGGCGCGESFDV